ncbi:MAG: hypothetical protein COA78_33930 [Blastopirellula sp.]|nr:MAG: hypothetical protein COA78_33930 [Blastopirellula sp.]
MPESAHEEATFDKPSSEKHNDQLGPFWFVPPRRVLSPILFFLCFALYGQIARYFQDSLLAGLPDGLWILTDAAMGNFFSYIALFFATMISLIWFTFFSKASWNVRITPVSLIFSMIVLFFIFYKLEQFSGELVPTFTSRFSKSHDQRLEKLGTKTQTQVDENAMLVTSDKDFPQFLGPTRNLVLSGPAIEMDWAAHPPQELWRQPLGAGWSGFVVVDNRAFTMEQRGHFEYVSCYSATSGSKPLWSYAHESRHYSVMGYVGPRSTPTVFESKVYALGGSGNFVCLNAVSGELIWQKDLLGLFGSTLKTDEKWLLWGRANSPLIVSIEGKNAVVIPAGGPSEDHSVSLVAFDADTGEIIWQGGDRKISYASPGLFSMNGKQQIISVNEDTITGHEISTGKELWGTDWPGNSSTNATCSQALDVGNNQIFVSKSYGQGARLFEVSNDENGNYHTKVIWEDIRTLKTKFTNVAIKDGYIYGLSEGMLECVHLQTGKRQWKQRGFGHGQLLIVGNALLIMTEEGELVITETNPDAYTETSRIKALYSENSPCWNNLCVYGDLLLVRNAEQAACYRLPTAAQ